MDAVRGLAASVEEHVDGIRRDLESLAGYPDVCRLAPSMRDILSSYLKAQSTVLDSLTVLDAGGRELWSSSPASRTRPQDGGDRQEPLGERSDPSQNLRLSLPIELDGRRVGTLCASVNIYRVSVKCKSKADSTYKSLYWLLSDSGQVIHGDGTVSTARRVTYVLRDAGASKETLRNVELLPYVLGQCVVAGQSGLAEVVRQEDRVEELVAFAPISLEGQRFGLVVGSPRAEVSVPITSHERVTYALIAALAMLYFVTGYVAHRSERTHAQFAEHRRLAAEQASKAKGDFLAQMSHELRTPMNGVIAMTDLALTTEDAAEKQRYISVVKDCANSLLSVVSDILDMSKIEAGKLELCHVPFNVPECVTGTLASLSPLADRKGLCLRWEIDPGTPSIVCGDPGRLRQILTNLVGNAIKFTSVGEMVVGIRPDSTRRDCVALQFTVRDTGPGMSEEDRQRVFVACHQRTDRDKYRRNNTGLGLAIAKQLVELMGGLIWIESAMGEGTVFAFTATFDFAANQPAETGMEALPSLKDVRALVICRVPANQRGFLDLLGSWGVRAESAESPDAGLLAMKEAQDRGEPFRLILYDSAEQPVDAFAFAETASGLGGYEEAALAVIYPEGFGGDAAGCLRAGIDAYLGVPFSDQHLHTALRMALRHAMSHKGRSQTPDGSSPDAPSLRILLVEDDPVNQQATSLLLSRWGHQVRAAGSGEEAISVLSGLEFDLILMDLEMSGMNGIETTARIRQQEQQHGRRTPIIAMTAYTMDSDCQRCMSAGMDDYVSKPFRPDHLRRLVARIASENLRGPSPLQRTVPAPAASDDQPVWDIWEVRRLANGNEKAVGLIIKAFLEDFRRTLPAAENAALARDAETLARLAHRWKGALGLLGARRALSWAVRLEEACGANEPQRLLECFDKLRAELCKVEDALSSNVEEDAQCKS